MKKKQQEKKQQLTEREIKELMGVHKQTYRRTKGGALRAK